MKKRVIYSKVLNASLTIKAVQGHLNKISNYNNEIKIKIKCLKKIKQRDRMSSLSKNGKRSERANDRSIDLVRSRRIVNSPVTCRLRRHAAPTASV